MTFAVVGNLVTATYGFTWLGVGEEPALFYIVDARDLKGRQQTTTLEMPSSRLRCLRPGPPRYHQSWGRGRGQGALDQESGEQAAEASVFDP